MERSYQLNIRLKPSLEDFVRRQAEAKHMSLSQYVKSLIVEDKEDAEIRELKPKIASGR